MNGGVEILNIGPLELIIIVAVMILLLGPQDMHRLARNVGALIRSARHSSLWQEITRVDREIRDLPVQLAREAGFEEQMEEIRRSTVMPPEPESPPGEVRSSGSRLRPPMRRGTPPPPPRTEIPQEDDDAQAAGQAGAETAASPTETGPKQEQQTEP